VLVTPHLGAGISSRRHQQQQQQCLDPQHGVALNVA
jgi:hypothetical protein